MSVKTRMRIELRNRRPDVIPLTSRLGVHLDLWVCLGGEDNRRAGDGCDEMAAIAAELASLGFHHLMNPSDTT